MALAIGGCGEPPQRVRFENSLAPLPVTLEVAGRPAVAGPDFSWHRGESIRASWDRGCGQESASVSVVKRGDGLAACLDGYDCDATAPADRWVQWIDVAVDNRLGSATTVAFGAGSIPIAEKTLARIRVPASTCPAGARVTVGDIEHGRLPLVDPAKSEASRTGPVAFALVDLTATRCYRLRGGALFDGDVLLGRALHVVDRIDDLFPSGPANAERLQLVDEPCLASAPEPATTAPTSTARKKATTTAAAKNARGGSDPVGDKVETLTPKVNACVLAASKGNPLAVKIAANVVVNLRGQLLEAKLTVSPPSAAADEVRSCVLKLLNGTTYPKNDVPITTVVKNWRVEIAR